MYRLFTPRLLNIYDSFFLNTATGNVVLVKKYQFAGVTYAKAIGGVFSLRLNHTNCHFGNPFSQDPKKINAGCIATSSVKESVLCYLDWVLNSPTSFSDIINHSGGAVGADSTFDYVGKQYGQKEHRHYYYGRKTPLGNICLTETQLKEGVEKMRDAAVILKRNPNKPETINLLARNWFQVKNSQQIIAIAPISDDMTYVEGGTGWAVAMGQTNQKEIHVFNLKNNNWYIWNGKVFSPSSTPILKSNFAGIGSRQAAGLMTDESISAIRDVYEKTKLHMSRLSWIRSVLRSGVLKGKPIVYHKELNQPSHANALDYLINKQYYAQT